MILERGNMWDVFDNGDTDLFLITTNPTLRKDGAVVMGRGLALQAAKRFPSLPFDFGEKLIHPDFETGPDNTGIIGNYGPHHTSVGYFMVKSHWRQPAVLSIIQDSLVDLVHSWQAHDRHTRVDLNFPGIGNGRLKREAVLELLDKYLTSDVYHVWEYG